MDYILKYSVLFSIFYDKYVLNQNAKKYVIFFFCININYILEAFLNCHQFRNNTFHSVAFLWSFCIKIKHKIK